MASRYDMIVFGASGFTGKIAVEELIRITREDNTVTWAISGRSQSKLDTIIKDLQNKTGEDLSKIQTIIADVGDVQSLIDMTKQACVLLNCCGPYDRFGEPVVKACIDTKTHYVDVASELIFMERMQLKYHEEAKEAGVYIVSACAFVSIPADMGVVFLQQNFKGKVNMVEQYIRVDIPPKYMKFGEVIGHCTAWESIIKGSVFKLSELSSIREQIYPDKLPIFEPKPTSRGIIHQSKIDNAWYLKLPGTDASVVNRSQRFFYDNENKRPAHMMTYFGWTTRFFIILLMLGLYVLNILIKYSFTRNLLLKYPRFFSLGKVSHVGPKEDSMKDVRFWFNIYGEGWDETVKDTDGQKPNKSMIVKVSGSNPNYVLTSVILILSAITIVRESEKMPGNGGVLSPGAAFSRTSLLERLQKNDIKFEVVRESTITL